MKILFTLLLGLSLSLSTFAQEHEVGAFVGATAFQGDLVDNLFDFNELSVGYGAFYRFYTSSDFSFRIGVTAGSFTADDANSSDPNRVQRGFSVTSNIVDATVIAEWNILGINIYGPSAYKKNRFSPYFLLGVGASMYNPEVKTTNTELRPLDAGKEYADFSMVIPMGLGLKYATDKITIGLEGALRAGLTDYLDGISKSGNPDDNDWYGFYGINAAYRFGGVSSSTSNDSPKTMDDFENSSSEDIDSEN